MDEFHTLSREELYKKCNSSCNGISTASANERLIKDGKNVLPKGKKKSAFSKIMAQFLDPMIIVLIIASLASLVVSLVEHTDDYIDAIIIVCIVIFNAIIGYVQEQKAENAIEELKNYLKKLLKSSAMANKLSSPPRTWLLGIKSCLKQAI